MAQKSDVNRPIREALKAEGVEELHLSDESGLPEMVTEIFRGRMRWIGAFMMANMACMRYPGDH
jgi:hypothetical protein